jgi:glycosyltransferase involved in cell wall biosynthesis
VRCQLAYHRPPQLWRPLGLLERELHHVDAFIAVSEFSRAKHREFGFSREMEVVPLFLPDPNPVEDVAPVSSTAPRAHDRPYFLFVGRLEKLKGLDDVIPLFHDERGADLVIAGDGEHGAALRAVAAGLPTVRFLGRVDQTTLAALYRDAIALIVPSVGFETFGMILVEAFRHGTPVIARRLGPFPEIVEASGGGLLFSTRDELAAAMEGLRLDRLRRDALGSAGRAAFATRWTESAVLPRYLGLIERVARTKGLTSVAERAAAG